MKIVITTFSYYPNTDGVAEASRFHAETFAKNGHDVSIFTSSIDGKLKDFIYNGVNVRQYNLNNFYKKKIEENLEEEKRFRSDIINEYPDLIISECWDAWPTVLALPVLKKLLCPKILVSHGFSLHLLPRNAPPPFFGFGQWWRGMIWTAHYIPNLIRAFDRFVFLSSRKDTKRFIDHTVMSFLAPEALRIIPNSPNLQLLKDSQNDFRKRHEIGVGPMILCVANYSDRKNQELALSSFLEAGIPGSTLVCIGSEKNKYFNRLESMLKALQPSHPEQKVLLLTGMTRTDTIKAYDACDLTLLTAHQETQPIVLIESMSFSKPWIATSSGCIMEMEGGIAVKNSDELCNWLKKLMTESYLKNKFGLEGHAAFNKYYRNDLVEAKWNSLIKGSQLIKNK